MPFDKSLDLALLALAEQGPEPDPETGGEPESAGMTAQQRAEEDERVKAEHEAAEWLAQQEPERVGISVEPHYPEWCATPECRKAWRHRPAIMRGRVVSPEDAARWAEVSDPSTGEEPSDMTARVRSAEGIPVRYSQKVGRNIKALSQIALPLEHGWTEAEVVDAMQPNVMTLARRHGRIKGKWDPAFDEQDAIQIANLAVIDALRHDAGRAPFSGFASKFIINALRTARDKRLRRKAHESPIYLDTTQEYGGQQITDPFAKQVAAALGVEDQDLKAADLREVIRQVAAKAGLTDRQWEVIQKAFTQERPYTSTISWKKIGDELVNPMTGKQGISKQAVQAAFMQAMKRLTRAATELGLTEPASQSEPGAAAGTEAPEPGVKESTQYHRIGLIREMIVLHDLASVLCG
jgi:hypothetical protein